LKIQFLNGGLANQTFQYIFYRCLQLSNPDKDDIYMDDSYFAINTVHNGYELEKVFGVKPNFISEQFDKDVWEEIIVQKKNGKSIPQLFLESGKEISMIAESGNFQQFNPFMGEVIQFDCNGFHPNVLPGIRDNEYYHGYWINRKYFELYRETLIKELSFSDISENHNKEYAAEICENDSFALHIRRGDFVTLGYAGEPELYHQVVELVLQSRPNAHIIVFSDDINFCKNNDSALGLDLTSSVTFIEGNEKAMSFRDLQLMSMCKGMLITNSSFDYLASVLNSKLEYAVNLSGRP